MTFRTKRNVGLILIYCLFAGLITSVWWELNRVNESILKETAVVATNYLDVLESFRSLYTSEVVGNIDREKIRVSHDYGDHENAIPLPATMTLMLAKKASSHNQALAVSLFSSYPFPWRKDRVLTDYDINALERLNSNPSEDIIEVVSEDGKSFLRATRADVLQENCVSCHNTHPDTPKTDWKVGDVRGALSVKVALDQSSSVSRSVLKELMLLILITSLIVMVIIFRLILEEKNHDANV